MDISSLTGVNSDLTSSLANSISSTSTDDSSLSTSSSDGSFSSIYQSALDMVNDANDLQNDAEVEEIKYALGYSDSTHDLTIAQEKADVALQYTVAVRDKFLEAYQEIMNIQI